MRLNWMVLACAVMASVCAAGEGERPRRVYVLDMTSMHGLDIGKPDQARMAWDTMHLVASLQGIVNRDQPRLFVRFMKDTDDFWFTELRRRGNWLAGAEVVQVQSLDALLMLFRRQMRGIVIYDERVPATSNLASTIAGIEDRLCLRFDEAPDSICQKVLAMDLGIRDVVRLMDKDGGPMFTGQGKIPGTDEPSTGSAKNDAYLWAKRRYIDSGRCSREYMAYYIDAHWLKNPRAASLENVTLTNHDFFISQRAFFFDLGMWEEESPVDDPGQKPGTDVVTLRKLMAGMYERAGGRIIHIGGFVPWAFKYTDHGQAGGKHGGVDSEWKYAKLISSYNGVMDADAIGLSGMANASFHQHHPLRERYAQKKPTMEDLKKGGLIQPDGSVAPRLFVLFYMGDYDSAAWLSRHVPLWWKDPARATIPCGWAFNPNLDRRAPHVMDFVRRNASPNDWFIAGDCGAGYLNPGMLLKENRDSGLPDGLDAWVKHNAEYYRRYDISITGFIIDGHSPEMGQRGLDAYAKFSPDGVVGQRLPSPQGLHRGQMPFITMKMDLDGDPKRAGSTIANMAGVNLPKFAPIRTILKSPTWHRQTMDRAVELARAERIQFVDPYTFFLLLKAQEQVKAGGRAADRRRDQVSFISPLKRDGLAAISIDDGPFAAVDHAGRPAIRQQAQGKTRYLYFEADDAFCGQLRQKSGGTVMVTASILDSQGTIGMEYDSHLRKEGDPHQGAYTAAAAHKLAGSGRWVELTWELPQARFAHRQNGTADFRLVNFGADLLIHSVVVRKK